ncbi:hypothetical protein U1Q18_013366 [Sarracenia purpurea var. burkii]
MAKVGNGFQHVGESFYRADCVMCKAKEKAGDLMEPEHQECDVNGALVLGLIPGISMKDQPMEELNLENMETVRMVEESISSNGAKNSNNCIHMANTSRGLEGLEDRVELEVENMGSKGTSKTRSSGFRG